MKESDKTFLIDILRHVEKAFEDVEDKDYSVTTEFKPWGHDDRKLRLSGMGKRPRYLAHCLAGSEREPVRARSRIIMDMGHLFHDYLREVLALSDEWTVMYKEHEVVCEIEGQEIVGHIDLILRDNESGALYLVDIKTIDQFGFVETDPRNNKEGWWARTRTWASTNFVFEAYWKWLNQPFKESYLHQIESYREALEREGIVVDDVLFMLVNRNTGHIAMGLYEPDEEHDIRGERNAWVRKALDAERPEDLETCWPAEIGAAPDIQCQYCAFTNQCFELKERVYKGKPQVIIKSIKS